VTAACLIGLGAVQSASVQFADPTLAAPTNPGKGKGPKCIRHEVFCNLNGAQCEMLECDGNSCNCVCVPIPGCVPTQ
jgi:hypothetical protein